MKPHLRLSPVVVIALVVVSRLVAAPRADDVLGKVLLLDNQRVLEGEIARVGDQYRVRRDGGDTLVPANRVSAVCADLNGAYKHLRDRTDPKDVGTRLHLARWCDANGLRLEAAAEAQTAVELQPRSAAAQALLKMLRQKAAVPAPVSMPVRPAALVAPATFADPIDLGSEAFKRFATKVQPVLMNTCVNCHSSENAGKFRLARTSANGQNSTTTVPLNLAAALAQIDRAKPLASPLLQHATAAHGGAAVPPLRDRGVPAFKQLEEWVRMIVDETAPATGPAAPTIVSTSADIAAANAKADADPKSEFGVGIAAPREETKDPFDPAIFNRQHHSGSAKSPPSIPKQ